MSVICGIDPGLKGGIGIYTTDGLISAIKTPVVSESFSKGGKQKTRNTMDLESIRDYLREYKPSHAVLEKVAARTGQGVTSMFRFGMGLGEYRGLLVALDIPFITPTPQSWKKEFGLSSDKDASLVMARDLFPSMTSCFKFKNCDGMAEAGLMAKYGFDNHDLFLIDNSK